MRKETSATLALANFTTDELLTALVQKLAESFRGSLRTLKMLPSRLSGVFMNRLKPRLGRFTELCSWIAGQPLTTDEALRILHAGIALVALIFPVEMSVLLRGLFLLWLALALWRCRQISGSHL